MRTNGYLQIEVQNLPEFDSYGIPINTSSSIWSNSIRCNIKTNTSHKNGVYQDGSFIVAKYDVLIESQNIDASRIKLFLKGKDLGEFDVQDIQFSPGVGRIKITV